MLRLLGTALTLGVAGLDPTAALVVLAALVAGAGRSAVRAFGLTVMLGAPLFGSVLSLTVGVRLSHVDLWFLVPVGRVGAVLGLVLGVVLVGLAAVRLLRRTERPAKPRRPRIGTAAMAGAGVVYVLSLAIDPTFVAVTVLAGRAEHAWQAVAMQSIWAVLSQLPLLVLLAAVRDVGQDRAVARFQVWWSRVRPVLGTLVTVALAAAGLLLVLDALWWWGFGHFLLPDPRHRR